VAIRDIKGNNLVTGAILAGQEVTVIYNGTYWIMLSASPSPTISQIVNTGVLTLPTSTDTLVGRTTTDTLSNKTLLNPLFSGTIDGWISANETWTYASATVINVPSGATSRYQKGDKIKLTQAASTKYFYVIDVASTTLTITGGVSYTITSDSITNVAYSRESNPFGFPPYMTLGTPTWTASGTAFTNQPTTNNFYMTIVGAKCIVDAAVGLHAISGGTGVFIATFSAGLHPTLAAGIGAAYNVSAPVGGGGYCYSAAGGFRFMKYDGTAIATNSQYFNGHVEWFF
jgi:uncharacterized protein YgiM (DUF1202 family)